MTKPTFTRASGTGNTFIFLDELTSLPAQGTKNRAELARYLCTAFPGFKSDGFLVIKKHADLDFEWEFYNSDGSNAEMCGNAARCAALYFIKKVGPKKITKFLTGAGVIEARAVGQSESGDQIEISFAAPKTIRSVLVVEGVRGALIDSGVPHFVIEQEPDLHLARKLLQSLDFKPEGANITFVQNTTPAHAVTFERGVEDFTQSCGTGALATAAYFGSKNLLIEMPGGTLGVTIDQDAGRALLRGPAQLEFDFIPCQDLKP